MVKAQSRLYSWYLNVNSLQQMLTSVTINELFLLFVSPINQKVFACYVLFYYDSAILGMCYTTRTVSFWKIIIAVI